MQRISLIIFSIGDIDKDEDDYIFFSCTYGTFYSMEEEFIILDKSMRENKSEEICVIFSVTLRAVTLQKGTTKANGKKLHCIICRRCNYLLFTVL